jgi:hypothetical protein
VEGGGGGGGGGGGRDQMVEGIDGLISASISCQHLRLWWVVAGWLVHQVGVVQQVVVSWEGSLGAPVRGCQVSRWDQQCLERVWLPARPREQPGWQAGAWHGVEQQPDGFTLTGFPDSNGTIVAWRQGSKACCRLHSDACFLILCVILCLCHLGNAMLNELDVPSCVPCEAQG